MTKFFATLATEVAVYLRGEETGRTDAELYRDTVYHFEVLAINIMKGIRRRRHQLVDWPDNLFFFFFLRT